jgi:hypothetical protein
MSSYAVAKILKKPGNTERSTRPERNLDIALRKGAQMKAEIRILVQ